MIIRNLEIYLKFNGCPGHMRPDGVQTVKNYPKDPQAFSKILFLINVTPRISILLGKCIEV